MARSARQSKILELISLKEIETQDELARELKLANFDITQATISRDIKELGLTKILTSSGKYKYSIVGTEEQCISNKNALIFKEAIISVKTAMNLVVLKTIKGLASGVCSFIDKLNLDNLMGAVNGDDCVMLIFPSVSEANTTLNTINSMLN
jgi:transcriptional regulator of arginine metabolism